MNPYPKTTTVLHQARFWSHASTLVGLLVLSLLCTSGCATRRSATDEDVCFKHTAAYDRKLQSLTLTVQQAKDRAIEFVRKEQGGDSSQKVFIGDHTVIVGQCFVFSPPRKADVSLNGYYVDGHTGEVTRRGGGYAALPKFRK